MSESLTTFEIKISRAITDTGEMVFRVTLPEIYSGIEALGLLESAKYVIYKDMSQSQ